MKKRIGIAGIGLFVLATSLSSCVVVAAGAGAAGAAYVMGSLDGTMAASPEKVVDAAKDVLKDKDIKVVSADASGVDGRVVGKTALEKEINITVKRTEANMSKVSIRVGTFGDQEISREIYAGIQNKLGIAPPPAAEKTTASS